MFKAAKRPILATSSLAKGERGQMAYDDDDDEPGTLVLQSPEKIPLPGAFRPAIAQQAAQPQAQPPAQPRPRKPNWHEGETGEEHTVDIASVRSGLPVMPFARADKIRPAAAQVPPARLAPTLADQTPQPRQRELTIGQRMAAEQGHATAAPTHAPAAASAPSSTSTSGPPTEPARLDGAPAAAAAAPTAQQDAAPTKAADGAPPAQPIDPEEEKEFLALAMSPWLLP